MNKILFVANVAKEHIIKFHVPTIKEFKDNGWIVDIACSGKEKIPFCDHQFEGVWLRSPFTLKTVLGIAQLKKIIVKNDYDIIFCHTPVGGLVGRVAAKLAKNDKTKVIYCAHGLHFYSGAPLINWLIYYPVERILANLTDVFFAVNDEDYSIVKKKFTHKLQVYKVPEVGVDFSRLSVEKPENVRKEYRKNLNIPQDASALIYVAELIKNKNQRMLIDALNNILKGNTNVYLILVGPDHNNGRYQKYVKKLGIGDHVYFLGWRSDIGELLYTSDVCVASSYREGFGINIVEAMKCGLPVVATKNRGHVTVIEDGVNGLLVDCNDSISMAKAVNQILNDNKLRKRFSSNDVSKYDCNIIAKKLFTLISQINVNSGN